MRQFVTSLHVVLAAFLLPMGLLYAITGGLYTWDVTGSKTNHQHELVLAHPLTPDLGALATLAERELAARGIPRPSGAARVRRGGTSFYFEWTGTRRDVQIHPTAEPLRGLLVVSDAGTHRYFVQLHKAKGGIPFKVYAVVWAVGLLALLGTGCGLAWLSRPYRRLAVIAAAGGLGCFALLAWLS